MTALHKLSKEELAELLDHVSACQSAYHIDSTPNHRFGGLPSNLADNRQALVDYVEALIAQRQAHAESLDKATLTITFDDDMDVVIEVLGTTKHLTRLKTWLNRCEAAVLAQKPQGHR